MVLYRETQYVRHVWWVMLLIMGLTVLVWWGFVEQIVLGQPWGTNPGPDWVIWLITLIFGIAFPLVFIIMRLVVELSEESLTIAYIPLTKKTIPLADIEKVEARTYKPLREYGGWGIRGYGRRQAYNVWGNQGAEITLRGGNTILIGSQRAQELALAIESQIAK